MNTAQSARDVMLRKLKVTAIPDEPEGFCEPGFEPVRDVFVEHFRAHPCGGLPELGASVAVFVDGRAVVDLWSGWADAARTRPWQSNTIVNVFSCSKAIGALATHQLVDEGLLDCDARVADYWPEFGTRGKERITVRQVLSHQAGLPQVSAQLSVGGVWDRQAVVDAFAAASPIWEPGTARAYHELTYGHILDELCHRVAGTGLAHRIRSHVAEPLGVDFAFGLTADEVARCADMTPFPGGPTSSVESYEALTGRSVPDDLAELNSLDDASVILFGESPNSALWRSSTDFIAAGGHSNARSMAKIFGALAHGGEIDGIRLVSEEVLAETIKLEAGGPDTAGQPFAYGLGYKLANAGADSARFSGNGFGHRGAYGALVWAEPERRLGFAYAGNQEWSLSGDPRAVRLFNASMECL